MTRHGWFNVPGELDLLCDVDVHRRWEREFERIGIDPRLLAASTGTA